MSLFWRFTIRLLLVGWAASVSLAQPGLPACWLEVNACETHIHFNKHHAETPHSHEYLFDLTNVTSAQALPNLLLPIFLLARLLFSNNLLLPGSRNTYLYQRMWGFKPDPHPPRPCLSCPVQ